MSVSPGHSRLATRASPPPRAALSNDASAHADFSRLRLHIRLYRPCPLPLFNNTPDGDSRHRVAHPGRARRHTGMNTEWDVIVVGAGLAAAAARDGTVHACSCSTPISPAAGPAPSSGRDSSSTWAATRSTRAAPVPRFSMPWGYAPRVLLRRSAGTTLSPVAVGTCCRAVPRTLVRSDLLGTRSKAQLIRFLGKVPFLKPAGLSGLSVAAWLTGHRLRPDNEAVVRALIRLSTYTADVDRFSADAAVSQLQVAMLGVTYLHGGWQQLVEGLARSLEVRDGVEVTGVGTASDHIEVETRVGTLTARQVVVAAGGPAAVRRLLPVDPGWGDLGPPLTAACLDLGVSRIPDPGYLLALDAPLYATIQSPPARLAPDGHAVVGIIRYGARSAELDRPQLAQQARDAGIHPDDVVVSRFLAHVAVTGALPQVGTGGLAGRPAATATGVPGVLMAGDWVGPVGLLADASMASGYAAGRLAGRGTASSSMMDL